MPRRMRYAMFSTADDPTPRLAVVHAGRITDVQRLLPGADSIPRTLLELIQSGRDGWPRSPSDSVRRSRENLSRAAIPWPRSGGTHRFLAR